MHCGKKIVRDLAVLLLVMIIFAIEIEKYTLW